MAACSLRICKRLCENQIGQPYTSYWIVYFFNRVYSKSVHANKQNENIIHRKHHEQIRVWKRNDCRSQRYVARPFFVHKFSSSFDRLHDSALYLPKKQYRSNPKRHQYNKRMVQQHWSHGCDVSRHDNPNIQIWLVSCDFDWYYTFKQTKESIYITPGAVPVKSRRARMVKQQ